jgi:hypothetical protein
MRILLRFVAGFTLLSVVFTVKLILGMWHSGVMAALIQSGRTGALTIAGWVITILVGLPSAILLWRQREPGRIGTIIVWASVCLYYLIFLILSPELLHGRLTFYLVGSAALVALLSTPKVRQACQTK